ncbi:hypothetical protein HG264_16810 [Pseudomonas sp. gcc21]|uniref:hypothetical protein n=1 Tax=Pseudomonas sp. gcc21 TaxID=2726989 RepID=UPI001451CFC4|nr:hypothetical protein [Pseudomonas sp. gcc21]QJD60414.1 hypothetical protein HG264_16810 [Pseudomonas sp. gcc21]
MTHDSDEPSRLLQDLESIRTLLDEHPDVHSEEGLDLSELDIPLLQDVFIESESTEAPTLAVSPPFELTPIAAEQSANPFLPYDSLARLAQERVHLDKLMSDFMPQTEAADTPEVVESVATGAKEYRLEERIRSEVQLVLQDVIDDMIPTIEAELRNRLRGKVEEIVREQLK